MAGPSGPSVPLNALLVLLESFVSCVDVAFGCKVINQPLYSSLASSEHGSNSADRALTMQFPILLDESSASVTAHEKTLVATLITSVQETFED